MVDVCYIEKERITYGKRTGIHHFFTVTYPDGTRIPSWELDPTREIDVWDKSGRRSVDRGTEKCFDLPTGAVVKTFLGEGDRKNRYLIVDSRFLRGNDDRVRFGRSTLTELVQEYWGAVKPIEGVFDESGRKKFLAYPVSDFRRFVAMDRDALRVCDATPDCPLAQVGARLFTQIPKKVYT